MRSSLVQTIGACAVGLLALTPGCQTRGTGSASSPAKSVIAAQSSNAPAAVRVRAGNPEPYTDSNGNAWLADKGFEGGDVIQRPTITIANTQMPDLYRSEHYAMESFSCEVPRGKYVAKLHFAETFEGISGPGERVFSFNVQGREFKDFDVWVKAGGANRAYIETVPVDVTNGKFKITFVSKVENPQINAIELIPQ